MKVMILDDERNIVEYMKHLLSWSDYGFKQVMTEHLVSKAKEQILANPPELLISDIKMPGMTGIQLAEWLVDNQSQTKIIFLTGYSDFSYAQQAIRLNVIDYLVKPINKQELIDAIQHFLAAQPTVRNNQQAAAKAYMQEKCSNACLIKKVQEYIMQSYQQELTLEMMSERVHLHPVYLSKLFKQQVGATLTEYITKIRLEKSVELLRETHLRIEDISRLVGYKKTQYFIHIFKRKYFLTPQQFRKLTAIEELSQ